MLFRSAFTHRFTGGSHHMILYATKTPIADVKTWDAFDCTDGVDRSGVLYASQTPEGHLEWPDGVAIHVPTDMASLIE